MLNQEVWVNVVTNPLGISAFALFLVFLVLTRTAMSRERRWLSPVFIIIAVIILLGGLALSYTNNQAKVEKIKEKPQSSTITIKAETRGENSPVIGTVGNDFNIGVDNSKAEGNIDQ